MKRIMPKKFLTLTLLIALVSMLFSVQVSAADAQETLEPGALTTPPPTSESILPLSINPSFKYLYDSKLSLNNVGNLNVRIDVSTMAYETVNSIGADVSIERWTGSNWLTIQTRYLSSVSTDFYSGSADFTVTSGYYYRAKSNHWATKGNVKEEFTAYTSSMLVTN
ncbi:hypothetical protein [Paenibacillus glacialis]|uniref:Uncharacterized protein n=1 Tax=Paenibacillus glacialis TaxID=494026 RepID=A0A168KTQ8_9BACL|nr:hypothetical protein [Paenibacillus glacialis]OAB42451.1 hypothetical protein PGLA_12325 [Paenibacillus glacialis]